MGLFSIMAQAFPQTEDFFIEILEWHVNVGDEFSEGDDLCSIYLHIIKENKEPEVETRQSFQSFLEGDLANLKSKNLNISEILNTGLEGMKTLQSLAATSLKPGKRKINASFRGVFIKALVSAGQKVKTDSVLAKTYLL